jgi:hypothetical protein
MKKIMAASALIVVALLLFGCVGGGNPPTQNNTNGTLNNSNGTHVPPSETKQLTKELCEGARGHWNECGSACRGAPEGTACIMMCVQYCECGGIAGFGCPKGYQCGDYLPKGAADAMGICKPIAGGK